MKKKRRGIEVPREVKSHPELLSLLFITASGHRISPSTVFLPLNPSVPGRCLPAGEEGYQGSLCLQLRTLSTAAGSRTSSPWRRTSRGQNSCRSAPQKRYNFCSICSRKSSLQVYTVSRPHSGKIWFFVHRCGYVTSAGCLCGMWKTCLYWLLPPHRSSQHLELDFSKWMTLFYDTSSNSC